MRHPATRTRHLRPSRLLSLLLPLLIAALPAAASDGSARIGAGDSAFGDLAPGETDSVTLDGVEGFRLTLDLRSAFEPRVLLRGPDGEAVDAGRRLRVRRNGARLRRFLLPATGRWTVEIQAPAAASSASPAKNGDDDGGGDDSGGDDGSPREWRMATSLLPPRSVRGRGDGGAGSESVVPLGDLPGGATLRMRVSRGTLLRLEGPSGALELEPTRWNDVTLPSTGAWSAVGVPSGNRPLRVRARVLPSARVAGEREVLDGGAGGTPSEGDVVGRTVLVRLKDGADAGAFDDRNGCETGDDVEGLEWAEVEVPEGVEVEAFLESLGLDADVVEGEPVLLSESPEGEQSNIAFTASEATRADVTSQEAFVLTGALEAQALGGGEGVVVAVLDTGVLPGHPDLAGRLLQGFDLVDGDLDPQDGPDGIDNDLDGLVDEGVGHGNFVAGIVAALAPEASILPVRVLDSDARGSSLQVARGIVRAVDAGAHVINLSLGVRRDSGVIQDAVKYARGRDVLVVVSSGNAGLTAGVAFPSNLSDVLSVTAVDASGARAPFANVSSRVDLAAPGVDLLAPHAAGGYARWSGTSFAAPFASAGAALVIGRRPGLRPRDAGKVLEDTAVPLDAKNPGLAGSLGSGRIDLAAAVGAQ